jgi:hypothetical protein
MLGAVSIGGPHTLPNQAKILCRTGRQKLELEGPRVQVLTLETEVQSEVDWHIRPRLLGDGLAPGLPL